MFISCDLHFQQVPMCVSGKDVTVCDCVYVRDLVYLSLNFDL